MRTVDVRRRVAARWQRVRGDRQPRPVQARCHVDRVWIVCRAGGADGAELLLLGRGNRGIFRDGPVEEAEALASMLGETSKGPATGGVQSTPPSGSPLNRLT